MHEHIFIDNRLSLDKPEKWQTSGIAPYPDTPSRLELWSRPLTPDIYAQLELGWPQNAEALVLDDELVAAEEINAYRELGGGAIVEVSSIGLNRSPEQLHRVSMQTGVPIIMGTGWYLDEWMPDDVTERSINDLAAQIVRDITVGIGLTGIRAGIIGEVGAEAQLPDMPMTLREIKSVRAAARAALATGSSISLHTFFAPGDPFTPLDILAEEGMPMDRVIVGHVHAAITRDLDYLMALAARGIYLEFDLLGYRESNVVEDVLDDRAVAEGILTLIREGFGRRILVSHDVYSKIQLRKYGGHGYTFVHRYFLPYLRRMGASKEDINRIMIENPGHILTFATPILKN